MLGFPAKGGDWKLSKLGMLSIVVCLQFIGQFDDSVLECNLVITQLHGMQSMGLDCGR